MKDTKMHNIVIVVLLLLLIASLMGLFNRGGPTPTDGIVNAIKGNQAVGGIIFDVNGNINLIDKNGKPGTPCYFAGSKGPACRGFDGGQVLGFKSISLIQTKGSICYATTNSQGRAIQICF